MPIIQVRPVEQLDLPKILRIDAGSSTDHVWQLDLHREPRLGQVSATFREARLPRPVRLVYPNDISRLAVDWKRKMAFLVAFSEAELIGYLVLTSPRSETAWITDIVVSTPWRRRGAATALMDEARRRSQSSGHKRLFFETQSKNFPAIMLAQKMGYEFCGYNDRYYANLDIALTFARDV